MLMYGSRSIRGFPQRPEQIFNKDRGQLIDGFGAFSLKSDERGNSQVNAVEF